MTDPQRSTVAGTLMIASGALTTLASAGLFFGLVWVCVGVFWLVPLAVGVSEIVVGAAIMGGIPTRRVRTVSVLGMLSALMCGNLIGLALEAGALALVARSSARLDGPSGFVLPGE
jgi:hypothetical protein